MSKHPSFFLMLAAGAAKHKETAPETVEALRTVAKVEQKYGLRRALAGVLSAYSSSIVTLAANGAVDPDAAVERLTELLTRATEVRDALRDGRPIPRFHIVGAVEVPRDTSQAWGRKGGHP